MPDDTQGTSENTPDPNAELEQKIAGIVNAAVTSHLKRSLDKAIGAALETALKPIQDKIAQQHAPQNDGEGEGKTKKKGQEDPATEALRREVEALKQQAKDSADRAAAVEKKAREDRAYAELVQSLDGKVRPEFKEVAAKMLFHADKRVEFDDDGNPLFKTSKAPYAGTDPEDIHLPLRAGVDDWLKSDGAKPFLPAPSTGSGAPPLPKKSAFTPTNNKKPTTDAEKIAAARAAQARVEQKLGR